MAWFPTLASLPLLSTLVASIHSLQDTLTVTTLPPRIQGTPSYRPTPTPGRVLQGTKIRHSPINMCVICCLVPWPPLLLPSVCLYNNTRKRKTCEKWGRPESIHHVNDVRWTQGRCRGEGSNHQKMHWIIHSNTLAQFWAPNISVNETTHLDR